MYEVQKLNNFCVFIMLLYCLFGSFFRLFDQEMKYKHFLKGLLLHNSGKHITKVKKIKCVFLVLLHNLLSGWNSNAFISERKRRQQQKLCLPGMVNLKELGKSEAESKCKFSCYPIFHFSVLVSP